MLTPKSQNARRTSPTNSTDSRTGVCNCSLETATSKKKRTVSKEQQVLTQTRLWRSQEDADADVAKCEAHITNEFYRFVRACATAVSKLPHQNTYGIGRTRSLDENALLAQSSETNKRILPIRTGVQAVSKLPHQKHVRYRKNEKS